MPRLSLELSPAPLAWSLFCRSRRNLLQHGQKHRNGLVSGRASQTSAWIRTLRPLHCSEYRSPAHQILFIEARQRFQSKLFTRSKGRIELEPLPRGESSRIKVILRRPEAGVAILRPKSTCALCVSSTRLRKCLVPLGLRLVQRGAECYVFQQSRLPLNARRLSPKRNRHQRETTGINLPRTSPFVIACH